MTDQREWPLSVVLSVTTEHLLADFREFHEFAEFLTSGPVWTHEFASRQLADTMRRGVLAQHPGLPTSADVTPDTWREWLDAAIAEHGATLSVHPIPDYCRTKGPIETLREMRPDARVVAVEE